MNPLDTLDSMERSMNSWLKPASKYITKDIVRRWKLDVRRLRHEVKKLTESE